MIHWAGGWAIVEGGSPQQADAKTQNATGSIINRVISIPSRIGTLSAAQAVRRRSRSSTGTRWTMEEGRRLLCNSYVAYTLKGDGFSFSIRDRGVLEEIDTGKAEKTTTFFLPSLAGLRLDGAPFPTDWPASKTFEKLELSSNAFELSAAVSATLRMDGTVLTIALSPRQT